MTLEQIIRACSRVPEEPMCRLCGEPYVMNCGDDPSPLCHDCAQEAVVLLVAIIKKRRIKAKALTPRGNRVR
jgi:hypothetical protein